MHMIATFEKQCWGFKVVGETPTKKKLEKKIRCMTMCITGTGPAQIHDGRPEELRGGQSPSHQVFHHNECLFLVLLYPLGLGTTGRIYPHSLSMRHLILRSIYNLIRADKVYTKGTVSINGPILSELFGGTQLSVPNALMLRPQV